ncbi:MAG: ABC transporter ATP-binding protein [Proteobacteria bacterium]|nr:ABC transporter ATP-binding protein [Pseudomonadota bacterium]MBS0462605.1 ABC transporter ATP-binding protein [Pseudomonadota bacterium]MBS0464388.1 ABC transporter ATP-binding protein [Pseudomonadota bacterium]
MSSETARDAEPAIRIDGVGKCYPVYARPLDRLRQFFAPTLARTLRREAKRHFSEYWALRDVSCEIARGEQVGIVGRNGAGKSTLLQIICGTLASSTGSVRVNGRIAALLELGAGFNPEFTGRENVILNAGILGLNAAQIDARMDAMLAFADIGDFIEQPVKTYSSGMYMRLAFAVAINVSPDILIVDEALSVGDEAFQRKCFARIRAIRDDGGTIVFVSHSAATVAESCDRALLLDRGQLLALGDTRKVLSRYQKLLYAPAEKAEDVRAWIIAQSPHVDVPGVGRTDAPIGAAHDGANEWFDPNLPHGAGVSYPGAGARIEHPRVETPDGRRVNVLRAGGQYVYRYEVVFERTLPGVRFGMMIKTVAGVELGGAASAPYGEGELMTGQTRASVRFAFRCLLAPGTYFLNAGLVGLLEDGEQFIAREVDVLMIRVQPDPQRLATGLVDFEVSPQVQVHD